jgi:hypothetical protein
MPAPISVEIYYDKRSNKEINSLNKKLSELTRKCGGECYSNNHSFNSIFGNIKKVDKFHYYIGELFPGMNIKISFPYK